MQGKQILLMLGAAAAVAIVGVVMAATGASRDTFMALLLLAAGGSLGWMGVKYLRNPSYVANGQTITVGKGTVLFMFAMAVLLLAGGLAVAIFGIPQN
jgi:hypothetical protein